MVKLARGVSLFINWFNGVCATVCGGWMMASALFPLALSWNDWMPLSIYDAMPFHDVFFTSHLWPGLALFLVNGVGNILAIVCRLRGNQTGWKRWCLVAGILLVLWTGVEMVFFPNALSVVYMVIGVIQILSWVAMRGEARG